MSLRPKGPLSAFSQVPLFTQLSEEMNRLFEQPGLGLSPYRDLLAEGNWQPAVDIEQKENKYIVRADIPGVDPKDIKISMDNGVFTIEGKKETRTEQNRDDYRRVERQYGAFHRSFTLSEAVDVKKIEAHCHHGVLEVTIPQLESAAQNRIEIKVD